MLSVVKIVQNGNVCATETGVKRHFKHTHTDTHSSFQRNLMLYCCFSQCEFDKSLQLLLMKRDSEATM